MPLTDGDASMGDAADRYMADDVVDTRWVVLILHKLLDKYESSKAFQSGEPTTRRIQLSLTDGVVPKYKSGGMDADERRELHHGLVGLEAQKLICLDWAKFEEGNLLTRIILPWESVDAMYRVLRRTPKSTELAGLADELDAVDAQLRPPWMQAWLGEVRAYVRHKRSIPESLIPADADKRSLLLKALIGISELEHTGQALPMRLFSKRYLKSSKAFEQQIRSRVVGLLKRYGREPNSDPLELMRDDAALLCEVGIEVTHEDVSFCGPVVLRHAQGELDGRAFPFGLALDTVVLDGMTIAQLPVARVVSIENKANYRYYIRNERRADELVIYLGGFPSPGKRRFLQQLWSVVAKPLHGRGATPPSGVTPAFLHWGDLDYGGILIGQLLKETVWPSMEPWRMEPHRLDELADFVEPFDEIYGTRLEHLLMDGRYRLWHPLIHKLLEVGGTLEQEAFLV